MADAKPKTLRAKSLVNDAFQLMTECGICTNVRELRMLPCQHMMCSECLGRILSDERKWCAFCKADLIISDAKEYPVCRLASNLQEEVEKLSEALSDYHLTDGELCQSPECRRHVDMFCTSCLLFQCHKCCRESKCVQGGQHQLVEYDDELFDLAKAKFESWKVEKEKEMAKLTEKQEKVAEEYQRKCLVASTKDILEIMAEGHKERVLIERNLRDIQTVLDKFSKEITGVCKMDFIKLLENLSVDDGRRAPDTTVIVRAKSKDNLLKDAPNSPMPKKSPLRLAKSAIKKLFWRKGKAEKEMLADSKGAKVVVALYDFEARDSDELSFKKGDRMRILDDESDVNWWLVQHCESKVEGLIPSNYVKDENELPSFKNGQRLADTQPSEKQYKYCEEISLSSIQLEKRISCWGDNLWEGKWNRTVNVTVKTFLPETETLEEFLAEAVILQKLQHENIIHLHGIRSMAEPFYIIMEHVPHGDLLSYLREEGHSLQTAHINFAAQVASGMAYLERKGYVHWDLAARNVLIGESHKLKIANFQMAKELQNGVYNAQQEEKFPIKWTAPEAALQQQYTSKSDVWSFGILLVEIFTRGQTPYPGVANREVLDQLEKGYRHPKPKDCPDKIYETMMKCWHKDPDNRFTFEYLESFLDEFLDDSELYQEAQVA